MKLGKGETFGEIALITDLPRTASAISDSNSILLRLTKEHFKMLLDQYQNLRFNVISLVEQKLEESLRVNQQVQNIAQRTASPIRKHLSFIKSLNS